ncbi:hypothetical protein ABI59_13960 [Acidobacteria bacterium Mor1]|nr:hypothetical protein ABI59_13960 [Acidobacteria bacterium Mor1]
MTETTSTTPARIGHAHLHVRELDRSRRFYEEIVGLSTTESVTGRFAFLSAGHHHHDLALQAIGSGAPDPRPGTPGLYHVAFEADDIPAFRIFWDRLRERDIPHAAVDHGISWALYFDDPDGNGVEIYTGRRHWNGQSTILGYPRAATEAGA